MHTELDDSFPQSTKCEVEHQSGIHAMMGLLINHSEESNGSREGLLLTLAHVAAPKC